MKRLIKALIWILGIIVALVIVAVVLITVFVDPNDYKDDIAKLVKEQTGRDLTFTGDIGLSFFPWLGVEVGGVQLGNAPGFGDQPMAVVGEAGASIRILPLVTGSVEIGTVYLKNVQLNLSKNAQGVTNWDDLTQAKAAEATPATPEATTETTPEATTETKASKGFELKLGGLEVENVALVFDDRQAGKTYTVQDLDMSVGSIAPGEPFDFEMTVQAEASDPQVAAQAQLKGVASLDMEAKRYEVDNLTLDVDAKGQAVPGGQTQAGLTAARLVADLNADTASVDNFTVRAYGVEASGSLAAEGLTKSLSARGSLGVAPFNLKDTLAALGQTALTTTDPEALTKVALQAGFAYAPDSFKAEGVNLTLDQTTAQASLNVKGFAKPSIAFTAQVDAIDVDRYLPPKSEAASTDEPTTTEGGTETGNPEQAKTNPAEALRNLNLDGTAQVGSLKIAGGQFTDITVTVKAQDGVLTVKPAALNLYGGHLDADYTLDARPETPSSAVNLNLADVNVGPALEAFAGKAYLTGQLNLKTTEALTFQGLDGSSIRKTLNGAFTFQALNGALPSGGVASQILKVASVLLFTKGQSTLGDNIAFNSITADSTIKDGVVNNGLLLLKSPSVWAKGYGLIDLDKEIISYQAATKLVSNPDSNETFENVTAPEVDVAASGSLSEPVVETGVLKGLGNLVEGVASGVGEGAGKALENVGQGAKETVKDLGKSLGIQF